ncbi:NUDIX domain-containing protein [Kineosporia sp. A_224]|uniref:NUDIX domain-containing protein n=1 Tax=Kineosporia sp. A_224 TaxID=1962180 RepID=UPI001E62612F|nr:NUDIX hydrolase [Kineosporia sp. A_224]
MREPVTDAVWAARLPDVFAPRDVGYAAARVVATTSQVRESLVSRLHLVAVTAAGGVLVCRTDEGGMFLPGGTKEPGETLDALAHRELAEEAGAQLRSPLRRFAGYEATSSLPQPYRPHQPHPVAHWVYAVAKARVVGPPTCPPDAEQVVEVLALDPAEAVSRLAGPDPLHAGMLRLALAMGLVG